MFKSTPPVLDVDFSLSDSEDDDSGPDILEVIYRGKRPRASTLEESPAKKPRHIVAPMFSRLPQKLRTLKGTQEICLADVGFTFTSEFEKARGGFATFYVVKRDSDGKLFGARITRNKSSLTRPIPMGPKIHLVIECHDTLTTKYIEIMDLWEDSMDGMEGKVIEQDAVDFLNSQLAAIHAQGWTHNDIIPKNILFRRRRPGARNSPIVQATLIDPDAKDWTEEGAELDRKSLDVVLKRLIIKTT